MSLQRDLIRVELKQQTLITQRKTGSNGRDWQNWHFAGLSNATDNGVHGGGPYELSAPAGRTLEELLLRPLDLDLTSLACRQLIRFAQVCPIYITTLKSMIFIGTVNLTRTRDEGNFLCPACGVSQGYRLRATRAWLTVYLIPTVPVSGHQAFVQCDHCKANWDPSVLEMEHPNHSDVTEEEFCVEAVRSAVLVVLADNEITENEISVLQTIASHLMKRAVQRDELGQVCSSAQQHRIKPVNYVLTVSRRWNQKQRVRSLQAMFLAAAADGPLGELQLGILARMQELFDLTDTEYHRAIEQAVEWEADD